MQTQYVHNRNMYLIPPKIYLYKNKLIVVGIEDCISQNTSSKVL